MMKISIDEKLRKVAPHLRLGIVFAVVEVTRHNKPLWQEIGACIRTFSSIKLEKVPHIVQIKGLRDVYKKLGKDPVRYRGSSEALLRRVIQGKGLYKVNTIVDINNLISLETMHSVGVYNLDNITSPVIFRIGVSGEYYKGIGKETINIAELPVFADENGPFGSPTSDSEKAMITNEARKIMMIIIAFSEDSKLKESLSRASGLFRKYASAQDIETVIVS